MVSNMNFWKTALLIFPILMLSVVNATTSSEVCQQRKELAELISNITSIPKGPANVISEFVPPKMVLLIRPQISCMTPEHYRKTIRRLDKSTFSVTLHSKQWSSAWTFPDQSIIVGRSEQSVPTLIYFVFTLDPFQTPDQAGTSLNLEQCEISSITFEIRFNLTGEIYEDFICCQHLFALRHIHSKIMIDVASIDLSTWNNFTTYPKTAFHSLCNRTMAA
eukprot:179084_1